MAGKWENKKDRRERQKKSIFTLITGIGTFLVSETRSEPRQIGTEDGFLIHFNITVLSTYHLGECHLGEY